jgi:hypothetical protein
VHYREIHEKASKSKVQKIPLFRKGRLLLLVPKMGLRALRRAPALLMFEMPFKAFLKKPLGFQVP